MPPPTPFPSSLWRGGEGDDCRVRNTGAHTGVCERGARVWQAVVNAMSVDKAGEMIASCSDDGTVVLNGLFSAECESFTYQRPVRGRPECQGQGARGGLSL